jgi:hypothetical protein
MRGPEEIAKSFDAIEKTCRGKAERLRFESGYDLYRHASTMVHAARLLNEQLGLIHKELASTRETQREILNELRAARALADYTGAP